MSADKTLSWSYTEEFPHEDEQTAEARLRGIELGIAPVSPGTGAALRMLAAAVAAKSVAEIGTGTGVSGLWLLGGMGPDGVLTTIDVEPEETAELAAPALRMLRVGGVLASTRALWNDHVADPARRDAATVAARELGKSLRGRDDVLASLLPVGDGLLVAVRRA